MIRRLSYATILALLLLGAAPPEAGGPFGQGRQVDSMGSILAPRERIEPVNRVLADRLESLLPGLMREAGIDMWLVINREYAEDPVYLTLVPEPIFAARRTTMLVLHDRGPELGVDRMTVSRYPFQDLYSAAWEGGSLDEQWARLAELIAERKPRKIGINSSREWAFADGLSSSLEKRLMEVLSPEMRSRVVGAEELCIRWLETRSTLEAEFYPGIVAIARRVIAEAFSSRVITPGVTTTDDVAWFIRERFVKVAVAEWDDQWVQIKLEQSAVYDGARVQYLAGRQTAWHLVR